MENHIFNGKTRYKWPFYAIFNSYVSLPEGNYRKSPFLMGKLAINGHFQ
jgi:hypothetical protein